MDRVSWCNYNLGRSDMYRYHVCGNIPGRVYRRLFNAWFPEFGLEMHYVIMQKIYSLTVAQYVDAAYVKDGRELAMVYLAADDVLNDCDRYVRNNKLMRPSKKRYHALCNMGLIEYGDMCRLKLTDKGRAMMEAPVHDVDAVMRMRELAQHLSGDPVTGEFAYILCRGEDDECEVIVYDALRALDYLMGRLSDVPDYRSSMKILYSSLRKLIIGM